MKKCILAVLVLLSSCSSVSNKAIDLGANVLNEASYEFETELNFNNFKEAMPANLKMIEGLLYVRKDNSKLLATLTRGYGAYGFVVYDTIILEDVLSGKNIENDKTQAMHYYNKSIKYGIQYLKRKDVEYQDLMVAVRTKGKIAQILDEHLEEQLEVQEAIFYLGLSTLNAINLNKNNMKTVAQLPVANELINWACSKNAEIAGGSCKIVQATYMASLPKAFGGNSKKAREIFLQQIEQRPDFWLGRVMFMQQMLIPLLLEDEFNEHAVFMDIAEKQFNQAINELATYEKQMPALKNKKEHIYQAVAMKRYQIMKAHKESIF